VVFWICLGSCEDRSASSVVWIFRPKEAYDLSIGDWRNFQTQLCLSLAGHLRDRSKVEDLVEKVFSKIRLADSAFHIPTTLDWAMPFSREETGLAEGSQFQVTTQYADAYGNKSLPYRVEASGATDKSEAIPLLYREKIRCETKYPPRQWPNDIKVEAVFLTKYVPPAEPALPYRVDRPTDLVLCRP